jgi:ferric-dicitrate binding protein FerR (iron transport regulator)
LSCPGRQNSGSAAASSPGTKCLMEWRVKQGSSDETMRGARARWRRATRQSSHRYSSVSHVSDDFHIGMRMRRETSSRDDLVVVPDSQSTPSGARGMIFAAGGKVVLGLEPTAIGSTQSRKWSKFNHRSTCLNDGYRCRLDMTPLTSLNLGTEGAGRT